MGMFLVSFVILVALVTVLSGIGVGEHCGVGSGGVYSMISSVLGGQTGGTIGLLYVFGQVSLGGWGWGAVPGGPRLSPFDRWAAGNLERERDLESPALHPGP